MIYSSIFGDLYFSTVETTGATHRTMTDTEIKSRIKFRMAADGTSYAKAVNVQITNWPKLDQQVRPAIDLMIPEF